MRPVCHHHGHVFDIFDFRNLMTLQKMFVKSIIVQKIAYTSIYDTIMSPEHFEIKNKDLRPFQRQKIDSYQLCL